MFDKSVLGVRVRCLRTSKNVNQATLAELLGVTKTQISDIENGKTTTSIDRLVRLADYFDVSLDYLVGRSDDPARH
jgi:transcriptional regulator with XRE-family HTH domain